MLPFVIWTKGDTFQTFNSVMNEIFSKIHVERGGGGGERDIIYALDGIQVYIDHKL